MFISTTGFTRGEVDAALWDRVDVDFYRSASKYIENWLPDLTGAISRRPPVEVAYLASPQEWVPRWTLLPASAGEESDYEDWDVASCGLSLDGREYLVTLTRRRSVSYSTGLLVLQVFRVDAHAPWEISEVVPPSTRPLLPDHPSWSRPFSDAVCFSQAGPSLFITSQLFRPLRFYVPRTGDPAVEAVTWQEELLGTVEVEHGTDTWEGVGTLFDEQLTVGAEFLFRGETYTVATITDNTHLTTTETYQGVTLGGERLTRVATPTEVFGADEYPALVAFHRGRLFLFSTPSKPLHMWASSAANPFVIVPGSVYDDAPINVDLIAEGAGTFQWVTTEEHLFLGSENGEFILSTPYGEALTPTSLSFSRISAVGGAPVSPVLSETSTLFVPRSRAQVLASTFDNTVQGYRTNDISLLAPHLLSDGVKQMALRPATRADRVPRLFVITQGGELRACALQERENVAAWSRVALPPGDTPLSLAATAEHVYVIVRRPGLPLGPPRLFLLRLSLPLEGEDVALDYRATFTPPPTGLVTPTEPLLGHSATVVSSLRGAVGHTPPLTGPIDMTAYGWEPDRGETVTLGVAYRSRLELLPASGEDQKGALLGRRRRMVRARLSVRDTAHLLANGQPLTGSVGTQQGQRLPARTGLLEYRQLGWGTGEDLELETATVYPAQILSVVREVVT